MLTDLHIHNFAIAQELELNFGSGFSVLTGETGAGKSILIGALGLVLGARADTSAVRDGADRADLSARFDIAQLPDATKWLDEHELDADECHLRRVINVAGRSKAFINGRHMPLESLRELGALLMDIHGQHDHQQLARPAEQRRLLDAYGGHGALLSRVRDAFDAWYRLDQQYRSLKSAHSERGERIDLLRFQVSELEELALEEGEFERLSDEQRRLGHLSGLAEGVATALDGLSECEDSAQNRIGAARRALESLTEIDAGLEEPFALIEQADILVAEATDSLRRYADALNMDPGRRDSVESRLDQITSTARKHRVSARELPAKLAELRTRFDDLDNADDRLQALADELQAAAEAYQSLARKLRARRRTAARKLAGSVESSIRELGMAEATFEVTVDARQDGGFGRDGLDRVVFAVTANPGQAPRPIGKVASGGELSRIGLAIAVVTAQVSATRCMVFDEVDAGVGGAVAEMVGARLRALGESAQVLCVTHLPQVASQAAHHFQVSKDAQEGKTRSGVTGLDAEQRVAEIARMLGGVEITERTLDHAAEMLTRGAA